MTGKATLLVLVGVLMLSTSAFGQFDYSGKRFGVQVDFGLGFTGGLSFEDEMELQNVEIDEGSAATLRFGVTGKFRVTQGFYIQPVFHMSFYGDDADWNDFQGQLNDGTVITLQSAEWNTTQISFGVMPMWYFRLANSPIHPYAGLALKFHNHSFGDAKIVTDRGDLELETESKFGFGIGPTVGGEFLINERIAIPLMIQYDLVFSSNIGGMFYIGTGLTTYF